MCALATLIPGVGRVVGTPRAHVFGGFHVGYAPPRVTSWVDSSGKNLDLDLDLDLAPERSLQYELGARYTFVNAIFAEGPFVDKYLPYSPVHTVAATLDVEHPTGVGAQLAWTMVGSQFADELNTVPVDVTGRIGEIKAHHLLDATARYRHARTGLTGFVSAKNLLNQIYVGSRRPDGIFPAGFRQVNVGLRWEYR